MTVSVTQETITPAIAERMLTLNTHNRNIRTRLVETLGRDMQSGQWKLNGETIKISETNHLIDGQHRLLAVIQSNKSIETMVVKGLPDDTQSTVDTGARRQFKDSLKLDGEGHTAVLAASTRTSWYFVNYGKPRQFGVSPSAAELAAHLARFPNIRDFTNLGIQGGRSVLKLTPSVVTCVAFHMSRIDSAKGEEFWRRLLENDAPKGSAIFALRESLIRDLGRPHRMDVVHRMALVIKAWNYWIAGRSADYMVWRGTGAGAEGFPKLNKPDEVAA